MAKRTQKIIQHEYISTNQHQHGIWFRMSNIFVLLMLITIGKLYDVEFSDVIYLVPVSAIVGYDISGILGMINKFIGKRKSS